MGSLDFKPKKCCFECKQANTTRNKHGSENWYIPLGRDKPFCHRCYMRLFSSPKYRAKVTGTEAYKKRNRLANERRFIYAGKAQYASFRPLTGYCSLCPKNVHDGSTKQTAMHHALGYFATLPWFGRIELCLSCHNKEDYRIRRIRFGKKDS